MRYTNNKINSQTARIAANYNTNINGILINRYAVYGKIHDKTMLLSSINRKTKNALNESIKSAACIYWILEDKQGLFDDNTKSIAIKMIIPGENTYRKVWIYRNSRMLKYIQAAVSPMTNQPEFSKPTEKPIRLALYINERITEYRRERDKREYKHDIGFTYNKRIGQYKPEWVI